MSLETITVPNLSAAELVQLVQDKLNLTYSYEDYAHRDIMRDAGGKTFEVMVWYPRREFSTNEMCEHFPKDFRGNSAAFITWVAKNDPIGFYASIQDDRLDPSAKFIDRYVLEFSHDYRAYRSLALWGIEHGRCGRHAIVVFREVKRP